MRRTVLATFLAVITAVGNHAASISTAQQPPQAKPLHFEVATIRPGNPTHVGSLMSGGAPGGLLRMVNAPLKQWVEMALSVNDYALKAPAWLDTSRFDLDARVPADAPAAWNATPEIIRALLTDALSAASWLGASSFNLDAAAPANRNPKAEMMKALLIERFGLKWHEETQIVSGYELVCDKKVLAQPATLLERLRGFHGSGAGPTGVDGTNMSMAEFADTLGKALGRPIVDATHLSGGYDIKVMWRPSDDAELASQQHYGKQYGYDVDNLPGSAADAVREQLGLRLQSAKVPSKVIVVDNINRQPTAN